jgi:hypothetical protein
MQMTNNPARLFLLSMVGILYLTVACRSEKIDSSWRDRDIQIDGMQLDWENALVNLSKEKINIGIMNDNDYMYICLVPLDETIIRQAMMMGFTVWIESKRGKDGKFGIRYPIGMRDNGFPMRDRDQKQNPDERREIMDESLRKIQIIRPNSRDTIDILADNQSGLEVRVETRNERMVYELKIPLAYSENTPYAVGALPGDQIKIKFETTQFKRPERKRPGGERPEGGMPPGGGMPGGGVPGGGRGMRPGGGTRPDMPQPLKLEVKVKLASPPSE